MANHKVSLVPPVAHFLVYSEPLSTAAGRPVVIPRLPVSADEIEGNQFIFAECTPTNITSSFDPVNGTQSNAGATIVRNMDGFTMVKAFFFSLTARLKDNPSAPLLDNQIVITIGGYEVGRISIHAASQKCGEHIMRTAFGDTRFNINGTDDVAISMVRLDPNLVIDIRILGSDS